MKVNCRYCDKAFNAWPSELKRGGGKFCSRTCCGLAERTSINVTCKQCGKRFIIAPSKLKRNFGKYCSNACYYASMKFTEKVPVEERFFSKVIKHPDGFWEWTGAKNFGGYGSFRIKGKSVLAHRFSWELYYGKILEGMCVLHRNDCPLDVNPANLFLGTYADNNADMAAKGRASRGEGRSNSRLTVAKARSICYIKDTYNWTYVQIGKLFGVVPATARAVAIGENWAWATGRQR